MQQQRIEIHGTFVSPQERSRLVWLCATITGDVNAAEDLAQETLLEAWRLEHTLRDKSKHAQWLSGIARNICMRWLRTRGRDVQHLVTPTVDRETEFSNVEDTLADDFDLEVELERKELVQLLDRALALLPAETQSVLIKRYVEESSLAEIADQLQTNASVIAMRLQRGKLSLRRVLTRDMFHEIAPYVILPTDGEWEETPLWCHLCGQKRLLGKRNSEEGTLLLKCPVCSPKADEVISKNYLPFLRGIKGFKPLNSRLSSWCDEYYRAALSNTAVSCLKCGRALQGMIGTIADLPHWLANQEDGLQCPWFENERVFCVPCPSCHVSCIIYLNALVLCSQEGRRFSQAHSRMHVLPTQEIEVDGRASIVTRFESVADNTTLIAISDYETYKLLRVYEEC